jgi:hypothetical protein
MNCRGIAIAVFAAGTILAQSSGALEYGPSDGTLSIVGRGKSEWHGAMETVISGVATSGCIAANVRSR